MLQILCPVFAIITDNIIPFLGDKRTTSLFVAKLSRLDFVKLNIIGMRTDYLNTDFTSKCMSAG